VGDDDDDEVGLYRWKSVFSHLPLSKRNILSVSYLTAFLKSVKLQQSLTSGNVVNSRNQLWPSQCKTKWSYTVKCLHPVTAVYYNGKEVSFPGTSGRSVALINHPTERLSWKWVEIYLCHPCASIGMQGGNLYLKWWVLVKNTLNWSTVESCECELTLLFSVLLYLATEFHFRRIINWTPNKWRLV